MMPKTKTKKINKTKEEHKLVLWKHCLDNGWVNGGLNCLYSHVPKTHERVRINFRNDDVLKLEIKKPPAESEKVDPNRQVHTWVLLKQGPYVNIQIGKSGELIFPTKEKEKEKETSKKKTAAKKVATTEKESA